jgi:hypothetical protein
MNWNPKIVYNELGTGTLKTITFDGPPEKDPFNEDIRATVKKLLSNNGNEQVQFSYNTIS